MKRWRVTITETFYDRDDNRFYKSGSILVECEDYDQAEWIGEKILAGGRCSYGSVTVEEITE